jgi:hypothetical protein
MAQNLNRLIYTSSDYKLALSCNGVTVPLSTLESFDYGAKKETEYIHVIGDDEPVGLKTNTSTYPGKLSLQAGELELLLKALGFMYATQITNATVSIVSFDGNVSKILKSVVFDSHDGSVKAKDKHSLITLNFNSLSTVGM